MFDKSFKKMAMELSEAKGSVSAAAAAYIKTAEGWIYLTAIPDLANRKVVGWALRTTMKAEDTSVAALKNGVKVLFCKQTVAVSSLRRPGQIEEFNMRATSSVSS